MINWLWIRDISHLSINQIFQENLVGIWNVCVATFHQGNTHNLYLIKTRELNFKKKGKCLLGNGSFSLLYLRHLIIHTVDTEQIRTKNTAIFLHIHEGILAYNLLHLPQVLQMMQVTQLYDFLCLINSYSRKGHGGRGCCGCHRCHRWLEPAALAVRVLSGQWSVKGRAKLLGLH